MLELEPLTNLPLNRGDGPDIAIDPHVVLVLHKTVRLPNLVHMII